ncbi:hypothetical protein EMIHUDRAFT_226900 [Emiliania huxleyi CCMP1516]|uniref:EF-hand domain-containing protein n=2 Tax=Emiliania huxleyi TaxID=2903 RepID=A0A0D3KJW5_EMIH1|nr:hypothetical protein EMIHUDRAFT_226900 [Emiliania huxleyi CCMP1516]EOD36050.1 hypothetical protein EMIHUDRAFT_226900 [Emiliania huxleyi CCMP1516]|eukprot:XP_005788479.1 hypothetical protein EMIHUDRAFT_226900 [Emiliania huxleyi CCMP1516]
MVLCAADVDRLRRYATRRPAQSREAAEAERRALEEGVGKLARRRLREHMLSLMLEPAELDECWRLLRAHASPPASPLDERIDYTGFCRVADAMPARLGRHFFGAEHFLRFPNDPWGRVSIVHYFCWLRSKTAILRTRIEFSIYDHSTDGTLGEREREPRRVTAVRKFFFFLDPRRRGRMVAEGASHESGGCAGDLGQEELRQNWFSLEYAEMLYSDYLELDADQNGMLSVGELMRFRGGAPPGGGLTAPFVQRSELDYKSYLDFVLAHSYKGTPEALTYFFKLLDLRRRLLGLDLAYFFRAVLEKFDELGVDPDHDHHP